MRLRRIGLAACGGALLVATTLNGQFNLGTVTGRVTDSSGAIIPACSIVIQNADTKAVRTAQADAEGIYSIAALPAGRYSIVASKSGFHEFRTEVNLAVNQVLTQDIQLSIGTRACPEFS